MNVDDADAAAAAHSDRLARVAADPRYHRLVARRGRFTWMLTIIMLVVYFGYILLIAFNKTFLATRIGDGAMSIGIPIGLGVILAGIVLTGIYVRRANSEFDPLVRALRDEVE